MKIIRLAALIAAPLLASCSSGDDLQVWMDSEAKKMAGHVAPLPPASHFAFVHYSDRDAADPFAPKKIIKNLANAPDANRKKDFLENFAIDQLSMVGSISRRGSLWALVKSPDGVVSMAKRGDYLGQNFGKILSVQESGAVVKESVLDGQGAWSSRDVELPLSSSK